MDKELQEVVIELVTAQKQTTKNVDELRGDFKAIVQTLSQQVVLQTKIESAHKRIAELKIDIKEDIEKINEKLDDRNKLLVGTLISALGALAGVVFVVLKGNL